MTKFLLKSFKSLNKYKIRVKLEIKIKFLLYSKNRNIQLNDLDINNIDLFIKNLNKGYRLNL